MSYTIWPDAATRTRIQQQAVAEYEAGDSLRVIGMRHGCSYSTVRTLLREAGVQRRPVSHSGGAGSRTLRDLTREQRDELRTTLATRYADGLTVEELALLYGVPVNVVRRLLVEAEIRMRPQGPRPTATT